jgi:dUTP pyrophosphatase
MNTNIVLGYHKLHPEAFPPVYATSQSACFDLRVCLPAGKREVDAWTINSEPTKYLAHVHDKMDPFILLQPGDRVLLPTQLVLDIPEGYSVRLHARSGLALKGGLVLANAEGVIDSDYTDQLMVAVMNMSKINVRVNHGDRICQGEIVHRLSCDFKELADPIPPKGDRKGGFGSTGKA